MGAGVIDKDISLYKDIMFVIQLYVDDCKKKFKDEEVSLNHM